MFLKVSQNLAFYLFFVFAFLFSMLSFSQNVEDIFPTRVTTNSTVTMTGTGFTTAIRNSIAVAGVNITNRVLIGTTQMTFEVSDSNTSDKINRAISMTGVTFDTGVDTTLDYIAPSQRTLSDTRSYFVEEIYTTWDQNDDGNHFWRSNDWNASPTNNATWPDDKHELLGFKMYNGPIFTTGLMSETDFRANLPASETDDAGEFYVSRYKAYSTNGVQGRTNGSHFILTGDLIDEGLIGSSENATNNNLTSLTEIAGTTIFDVIVDGRNGLELGTGISNFNRDINVQFFSGNGQPGTFGDVFPDLLITQVAQAGGNDIYFYADLRGNIVGTPIRLSIGEISSTRLAEWQLDLFSFPGNQPFVSTNPNRRGFTNNVNQHRPIRMIAFKLEDFDINDTLGSTGYIGAINNVNLVAGGTADMAFLAYNAAAFDIKAPLSDPLLSKFICKVDGTSDVTFNVSAGVDDGFGGITAPSTPEEDISYEWLKYNIPAPPSNTSPTFTVSGVMASDLATYKVKVSNSFGTVILPVSLSEGGTPTFWNGTTWTSPFGTVVDEERNLVFSSSYNEPIDIDGCDCTVISGSNVVIPSGSKMVLYDYIRVQPEILATPDNSYVPPGTFILEDDASLVQTKPVPSNINSGPITMRRNASDLDNLDYVYWSSPVENFDISNIPGNLTYEWDTNAPNPITDSHGNWLPASGIMGEAKGYIKRVPNLGLITTSFIGRPINGTVTAPIVTTALADASSNDDINDWNLLGNPYPSAINAVKFLQANTNVEGFINIWTHAGMLSTTQNPGDSPFYENFAYNYGDQYLTHNIMGTTPVLPSGVTFNGNIAAGQAFFVQAITSGNVTFENALRYDASNDAYDNDSFYRLDANAVTNVTSEKQLMWLALIKDNDVSASTLLGYAEGATYDKDRMYDANTNGSDFSIYSMISEEKMVIQGRPLPFDDSDTVPLGIKIDQNGIYEIGIDHLEGSLFVTEEQDIYLEDTFLGLVHDLRLSPYTFTGEIGTTNDRFIVRYTTNTTLSVDEITTSNTFGYIANSALHVKSGSSIKNVQLYDLGGKQLIDYVIDDDSTSFNTAFPFSKGAYITIITLQNGALVTKKLMH